MACDVEACDVGTSTRHLLLCTPHQAIAQKFAGNSGVVQQIEATAVDISLLSMNPLEVEWVVLPGVVQELESGQGIASRLRVTRKDSTRMASTKEGTGAGKDSKASDSERGANAAGKVGNDLDGASNGVGEGAGHGAGKHAAKGAGESASKDAGTDAGKGTEPVPSLDPGKRRDGEECSTSKPLIMGERH